MTTVHRAIAAIRQRMRAARSQEPMSTAEFQRSVAGVGAMTTIRLFVAVAAAAALTPWLTSTEGKWQWVAVLIVVAIFAEWLWHVPTKKEKDDWKNLAEEEAKWEKTLFKNVEALKADLDSARRAQAERQRKQWEQQLSKDVAALTDQVAAAAAHRTARR